MFFVTLDFHFYVRLLCHFSLKQLNGRAFPNLIELKRINSTFSQENLAEETARDGDNDSGNGKWGWGMWKAVKSVPGVIYETSSMVAPFILRYMLSEKSQHPHYWQRMLCEMNIHIKDRFGKSGEIAMQLARYLNFPFKPRTR